MMRVLSRRKPLTISLSAPLRRTMAASGEPEAVMAFLNPTPIESTPTSTATTPAMPITAAATEPSRCGMLSKPNLLTEATCESQLMGPAIRESRKPKAEGRIGGEHDYILLNASATRRRMAWRAGNMPASTPSATLSPTPMSTSTVGK